MGWVLLSVRLPDPLRYGVSLFFQFFTYKEGFGFGFSGGALAPLLGGFSFVFSELSTGSSLLLLVTLTTCCLTTCMVYLFDRISRRGVYLFDRISRRGVYLFDRGKLSSITGTCG